jgi:hypothetical protein
MDYLLLITKPFFNFTNVLSKTRDILVHHVFTIYNRLFSHLDNMEKRLKYKAISWKKRMFRHFAPQRKNSQNIIRQQIKSHMVNFM